MNKFKIVITLFCVLFAFACATTPSYRKARTPTGVGYYDTLLQQNMYEITFNGSSSLSATTAQDYALLRAAETCLENGYQTFDIVKSEDKTKTDVASIPMNYGYYSSPLVFSETTPKIILIIKCSEKEDLTFIAEEIRTNLRKKYNLDKLSTK